MKKANSKDRLLVQMDKMAFGLLKSAESDNVSVPIRLDIFDKVAKYVAVKYKVEDNDAGGALEGYKKRIRRDTERDERAARRDAGGGTASDAEPDADAGADALTDDTPALGGPVLSKIRNSLPRAGPGGISRNSDRPGNSAAPTFVRDGGVLPVAVGVVESRRDETGS